MNTTRHKVDHSVLKSHAIHVRLRGWLFAVQLSEVVFLLHLSVLAQADASVALLFRVFFTIMLRPQAAFIYGEVGK